MNRIRINPGDTVPLFLDEKEWKLIRNEAPISTVLANQLKEALIKKDGISVNLTLDDLDELIEIAAEESERSESMNKRRIWSSLFARLRTIFDTYSDGEDDFWEEGESELSDVPHFHVAENLPAEIEKRIETLIKMKSVKTKEDLNALFEQVRMEYNQQPQEDMGGLTPEQVYNLVYTPWDDPQCLMQINSHLSFEEVQNSTLLKNARIFLQSLQEEGGKTKATSAKNLNRKFVEKMLPRLVLPDNYEEEIRKYCKVINELDVWPLHLTRILLELAGGVKRKKNDFSLTNSGKKWTEEKQAGTLFRMLFTSHFLRLNLAYLDRLVDNSPLQTTIIYSFFQLSRQADSWQPVTELANRIVLPSTIENAPQDNPYYNLLVEQVYRRIFLPLVDLDLLELRTGEENQRPISESSEVRKTPLYDRFFQFRIS